MSTPVNTAQDASADLPEFPMARPPRCPLDPPEGLRALQDDGPLTRVRLWNGSTPWLVTRHAEQKALSTDPRLSADPSSAGFPHATESKGGKLSFVTMDDPEHARLRRMVSGAFTVKRIEAMRPLVQDMVDGFIDDLLAGPNPVDLVEAFALPVPSLVICKLLDVPYEDHAFFQSNSKTLISRAATPDERLEAHQRLFRYLDDLVGRKMESAGDDLLSAVAARVTAGELSREDAALMGVLLLLGGHETTANMIALGTFTLLQHPEQLARLRETDDPKLIASSVEELLRYLTIAHNGRRRVALADIEIGGQVIRAGEGVIIASDLGNRDATVFPDPDQLDIARDARRHVAFGTGVHHCLGQPLARLELQVVYGTLYRRIPTLRLATDVDRIPFKHDGFIYGVHELPVTW